jgi:hypothetical protein
MVTHDSTVARRAQRTAWISKGKLKIRSTENEPHTAKPSRSGARVTAKS